MPRIGETPCCNPACGCTDATVNRTAGGKLQSKCHKCGTERWAPLGTKAHRDLMAQTRLDDDADPPPRAPAVALPIPEPEPVPAVARAARAVRPNNPFSIGQL